MLAHFNKMNTLLLFYRKMGNTLFLEQDEYIFIVFRNEERYFIFLTARWALSYHFIYIFIFLYISSLFQTLSKMCEAFDGSAVSTLRATSADSAFSQAAKKHKGKKGTFPRSTKKQRKQVQKKQRGPIHHNFPSSAKT